MHMDFEVITLCTTYKVSESKMMEVSGKVGIDKTIPIPIRNISQSFLLLFAKSIDAIS